MDDGEIPRVTGRINEILRIKKTIEKNREDIAAAEGAKNSLTPYLALDVPISLKGTSATAVRCGTLAGEWDEERLWRELREAELTAVYFEILSRSREMTAVWLVYPKEQIKEFDAPVCEAESACAAGYGKGYDSQTECRCTGGKKERPFRGD